MGDSVKGITEDNRLHMQPLCHLLSRLLDHWSVFQAGPAFHKPTLARPDTLAVLHMPCITLIQVIHQEKISPK